MAPCAASRRAIWSVPSSSSRIEMAERKKLAKGIPRAHVTTFEFARSGRLNSETTLVSRRNIRAFSSEDAKALAEVGRLEKPATDTRRLKGEFTIAWLCERFGKAHIAAGEALVVLNRQKNMRGAAPVCDENRPAAGRLLGATGVLIEFTAGQSRHRHLRLQIETPTILIIKIICRHVSTFKRLLVRTRSGKV